MSRSTPEWKGKTDDSAIPPRVRLRETIMAWSIPEPMSGCWLWERACQSMGYGQVTVAGKVLLAHRASFEAFNEVTLGRSQKVCHRCDNPICVNPEHLFVGTQTDNMRDCANKGRIKLPNQRGISHPAARLTEPQVIAIRSDGRSYREIAATYGISKSTVSEIRTGKNWGHL